MSRTSGSFSRTSSTACMTVCEYWPSGKRLMLHSMILNGRPAPPKGASSIGPLVTVLKYPSAPSKTSAGPVSPRAASMAANTELRQALAAAQAFQCDSTAMRG